MSYFETKLPQELNTPEYWSELKAFGKQWSQLVAWAWTDCLAYANIEREQENNPFAEQEQKLKEFFINLLQQQAVNANIYINCGAPEAQEGAEQFSQDIRNLLLGDNDAVPAVGDLGIEITLSDVFQKFNDKPLLATAEPDFTKMFIMRVISDAFIGKLTYAPGKDANSPKEDKYILELTYPPRPALGSATVTEEELFNWVKNQTPGNSYFPPSVYLPWSVC